MFIVDIIDISAESGFPGQIRQVKLLGGLLMIDDDATDWKVVAINVNDERANRYNGTIILLANILFLYSTIII